jgi:hypothetical protein
MVPADPFAVRAEAASTVDRADVRRVDRRPGWRAPALPAVSLGLEQRRVGPGCARVLDPLGKR